MLRAEDWEAEETQATAAQTKPTATQEERDRSDSSSSSGSDSSSDESNNNDDNEYDFEKATEPSTMKRLEEQPGTKNVYIGKPLKNSMQLLPATLKKVEVKNIFKQIAEIAKLSVGKFTVDYPVRKKNNKIVRVTVEVNPYLDDSLSTLYCQVEQDSTLVVRKVEHSSRAKKPCETNFTNFMKHKTVTRHTYALFNDNTTILESYTDKQRIVQVMLGNEASINLLNPGKFLCPIDTCRDVVNLKHFNCFHYLIRHFLVHKVEKAAGSELLVNRFYFLTESSWMKENKFTELSVAIDSVNAASHNGHSLSMANTTFFCPPPTGVRFKGKHLLMDEEIINKMIVGDDSALDALPASTITSYFSSAKDNSCV